MKAFLLIFLFFSCSFEVWSLAIERKTVKDRIINSEIVAIADILSVEDVKDDNYSEIAISEIFSASSRTEFKKRIKIYHSGLVAEEDIHCCGLNVRYLFFLKPYKDGYISAVGRYGAYEILDDVPIFLDETWMKTSKEHAEILLFLHEIYNKK